MERRDELDPAYRRDASGVARALGTDLEAGLTSDEVEARRARHGPNALVRARPTPLRRRVLAQFEDPLVYLLLVAMLIALVAWLVEGSEGWPIDAIVIGLVLVVNATLGLAEEAKAESAVAALSRMTEVMSSVVRDGAPRRVPSVELVPGDVLELSEGDAVGADARLTSASALRVQEAALTGESEAVLKEAATLGAEVPLGERANMVFKGTAVAEGHGRAVIVATGMSTEMGSIASLLEATREDPTPLQIEVRRLGRVLGLAVIAIAIVVVVTTLLVYQVRGLSDLVTVLLLGVSLAVAAVPEGLPAILSVVLALGVQRMAARHAIVKKLSSVETLGSTSVICSDKTGTLTRSEMTIERVATASGTSHVSGIGYVPEGKVEHEGEALAPGPLHTEHVAVLSGGSLASNADLRQVEGGAWEIQGDPTEAAFLVAERKLGVHERRARRFERIGEVPFSSARKLMSTIHRDLERGGELVVITKGAPDVLLDRCTRVRIGEDVAPLDEDTRERALADVREMTDAALRTLAVAYRPLEAGEDARPSEAMERELVFVGTVGIIDPPRLEVAPAVRDARRAGIRVVMITGDHPRTAARVAADLGILEPGDAYITGAELDALDDAALREAVRRRSVFARVAPAHKLRIVDALQADGHVVAMTGDGVNDAPALKSADIGIAMGVTGTEVTKEAAKMILADDNFATIVAAVREGRVIFDNIRKFLRFLLSSNLGEVLTVFLGVIGARALGLADGEGIALPLLATQLLWVNLVTDSAPALAMGVDPESDDVMARRPRRTTDRAIDAEMWRGALVTGLVMALATLLTIDALLPGGLVEGTRDLVTARTAGLTVLVLAQLFNCFVARSELQSAFHRPFVNPWLWGALALSAALQIALVHTRVLNVAFGTAPLSIAEWALCIAMASAVLWVGEARKLALRAWARRKRG